MDILDYILEAIKDSSPDAEAIFLGEMEMTQLKEWAGRNCYYWSDGRPSGRPEIHGLPVYRVDVLSYLRVV